jgi:Fe-S-cluster-containing hydrogenase component 2
MGHKKVIQRDYKACTGCRICELVCSLSHFGECNPERSRIRISVDSEDGVIHCAPILCFNCEDPACEKVCPTGATRISEDNNLPIVDDTLCIGCGGCVHACPFGASILDHVTDKAIRCDQCGGTPLCVQLCPKNCLTVMKETKVNMHQKRLKRL